MPELPEVQTVVTELNRKLRGRKIKSVEVRKPKLIAIGPNTVSNVRLDHAPKARQFEKLLTGEKFLSVRRRAKLLLFDLSGPLTMLVHLKMTGQFIFEDRALKKKTGSKYQILNKRTAPLVQLPGKYTHVIFNFTDGSTLYYNDLRQFGYLKLVRDDEIDQVKELNDFGPEPLDKKFTYEVFKKQIERYKNRAIKQSLTDPILVAGIGNIYSDEILFHAKVQPERIVDTLSIKELKAIYKYIPVVLKQGIKQKGSSVGDFIRTDGKWGSMGKFHYVYGRRKQPCKVCGTIIQTVKLGGRTGSYCPRCQK